MCEEKIKIQRRKFLGHVSKAGLLSAIASSPFVSMAKGVNQLTANAEGDHIFLTEPYLQAPAPDSMSIMWITNKLSYSWVEFGETGQPFRKAHEVTDGLVNAHNRINCIRLNGLKPATTYQYRVLSKEITEFQPYKLTYGETINSKTYQFTTPNPKAKEISWLVMNDIHDRPASITHLMKMNGNDPYDFVFLNGDMFDYQTDEQQLINHLIKPCTESFASEKPFMFVRGNHETRGKFARELGNYFTNTGDKYYFSFTRGPVHAIVLDTGEDKPDTEPVYAGIVDFDAYRKEQALWLEKQMQTPEFKKAKFRVVMMHIPHYYSGDWHGTLHCRELYAPLFDKYKIDLFLAGHTHKFGVFHPVKGDHSYPIMIGGGPKEGNRTLMKIKANERILQLSMLKDDGSEVGSYTLNSKR